MDDGSCGGAAVCEGVDVSHDIVPEFTLFLCRHGKVNVLCVVLHLHDLGICDGQTQSLNGRRIKRQRERDQELGHSQETKYHPQEDGDLDKDYKNI